MKPTHIEHIGIAVKSIEEALPFYENVLGLKCYAVDNTAQIVRPFVGRVNVCSNLFECRKCSAVRFKAAVQSAFQVNRLLLIVCRPDIASHCFFLVRARLSRQDFTAQHRAIFLHRLEIKMFDFIGVVVFQRPPCQII